MNDNVNGTSIDPDILANIDMHDDDTRAGQGNSSFKSAREVSPKSLNSTPTKSTRSGRVIKDRENLKRAMSGGKGKKQSKTKALVEASYNPNSLVPPSLGKTESSNKTVSPVSPVSSQHSQAQYS